MTKDEALQILSDCQAGLLITDQGTIDKAKKIAEQSSGTEEKGAEPGDIAPDPMGSL